MVEQIDIGGPAMTRAAAKNFRNVVIVVDPADYDEVLAALRAGGGHRRVVARAAGEEGVPPHPGVRRGDRRLAGVGARPRRSSRPPRRRPRARTRAAAP